MPANTHARYYQWFMTEDHSARLVAYEWWPQGEFVSSMTLGTLNFMHRSEPGDTWNPPVEIGEMPWVVAQGLARKEGFHVEVAVVRDVREGGHVEVQSAVEDATGRDPRD